MEKTDTVFNIIAFLEVTSYSLVAIIKFPRKLFAFIVYREDGDSRFLRTPVIMLQNARRHIPNDCALRFPLKRHVSIPAYEHSANTNTCKIVTGCRFTTGYSATCFDHSCDHFQGAKNKKTVTVTKASEPFQH